MLNSKKARASAVITTAFALTVGLAGTAHADQQPTGKDAVGVGSDTVQYVSNFVDDGDTLGDNGYNALNNARRVFSFDATGDASGRATYQADGSALNATVVLRAGSSPVARPNGSSGGITALLNDTSHQIDFVRSSRLPKPTEQTQASTTTGFGAGIHVYQIATDGLDVARSAGTTNAPAGLSVNELVKIYNGNWTTWSQVPGYAGACPSCTIHAVIPQSGSGTRNDFMSDLKAANGGVDVSLASVTVVQEHDPTAIAGNPNAIGPFSTGRNNLINSGYFGTTPAPNTISLLSGTAPDGAAAYHLARTLYILARDADVTSTKPFQVGGSLNLVKSLFGTSTSWYAKGSNSALFTAAGVTQSWADLGLAHS